MFVLSSFGQLSASAVREAAINGVASRFKCSFQTAEYFVNRGTDLRVMAHFDKCLELCVEHALNRKNSPPQFLITQKELKK